MKTYYLQISKVIYDNIVDGEVVNTSHLPKSYDIDLDAKNRNEAIEIALNLISDDTGFLVEDAKVKFVKG